MSGKWDEINAVMPWMDGETVDPKEFLQKRRILVTEAEAEELIKCGQDGRHGVTFKNLKEWKPEFDSQLCLELQKDLERRCKENSVGCVAPISAVAPTPGPGAPPAPPALLAPPAPAVPPAFAPMPPPPPPPITPLPPVPLAAAAAHALVPTPRVSAFPTRK